MGVKGLSTFLKDHRHKLSYTLELKSTDLNIAPDAIAAAETHHDDHGIRLVVDGWSLLYTLYNSCGEPWVYGGEYAALARYVESMVVAWLRVGIRPTFVFDGPTPLLKYPTVISRLQDNCVNKANLFFRTSKVARSTPGSLAETRIAPPLGYVVVVSTLLSISRVDVRFAEGEADSYIVGLAGRLGAYVTGNDSDFIVLNCEGYKGYIPLDEIVWCTSVKDTGVLPLDSPLPEGEDSEFQVVTRKKQKAKLKVNQAGLELGSGPFPPSSHILSDLSLVLTVFEPTTFANYVSLPATLLPLLGALIGNDYSSFNFFRSNVSPADRVQRVADALSSVLKDAQSGNAKKVRKIDRGGQGGVIDVIGTTVERLLPWHGYPPTNDEIDKITEKVVQSTLEYTMDSPESLFQQEHSSQKSGSQSQDPVNSMERVQELYLRAYHRGLLHPRLMEVFVHGACFPRLFLEDPDRECCARSIGRPVRDVIWKIFVTGGGIPDRPEVASDNVMTEDEDELVDVIEEQSDDSMEVVEDDDEEDPFAALRGKLQRLSFSSPGSEAVDLSQTNTASHSPVLSGVLLPPPLRPKIVTEYVRRGARVVAEEYQVTGLEDLPWDGEADPTPIQLRPVHDRLNVFLKVLGSDTPSVRGIAAEAWDNDVRLSGGKLLVVVTLRWVLQTLHARADGLKDGNQKREREREKWTRSDAEAFLSSLSEDDDGVDVPSVEDRSVQLSAQILSAFEAIQWLAEALLLVDLSGSGDDNHLPVSLAEAEKSFSGRKFHAALVRRRESPSKLLQQLWDASTEGLANVFGDERGRKGKKERKGRKETQQIDQSSNKTLDGMFGVLADLDVQ
ncbi:hypothetical protein JB92DRAFT_2821711 [Gautieria morchelliformis]|nr:hypothetical protein JB92DRAFT_2821711 [Gautieria morchelliformis]